MKFWTWVLLTSIVIGLLSPESWADEAYDEMVRELESDAHEVATYHLSFAAGNNSSIDFRREMGSSAVEAGVVFTLLPIGIGTSLAGGPLRLGGRVNWLSFGNSSGDRSIYRGIGVGYFMSLYPGPYEYVHPSLQLFTGYEVARTRRLKWFGKAELDISGERLLRSYTAGSFPLSLMFSVGGVFQLGGEVP